MSMIFDYLVSQPEPPSVVVSRKLLLCLEEVSILASLHQLTFIHLYPPINIAKPEKHKKIN